MGPVATQEAIKQLGTNGGGFFNANAAHPFENPTPLDQLPGRCSRSSLIPAALDLHLRAHGRRPAPRLGDPGRRCSSSSSPACRSPTGRRRAATRSTRRAGSTSSRRRRQSGWQHGRQGGALRHRELALFATVTTDASCGAVNAMHDSFTPLGGLVPLVNMQLGEVIFGGVGAGLYGMLVMVVLTRLHRRADGRPDAGVPRQEDRGARGPDGDAVRAGLPGRRSSSSRRASRSARRLGLEGLNNAGPHGLTRNPLRLHARPPATTAAPSPGSPERTYFYNTLLGRRRR